MHTTHILYSRLFSRVLILSVFAMYKKRTKIKAIFSQRFKPFILAKYGSVNSAKFSSREVN